MRPANDVTAVLLVAACLPALEICEGADRHVKLHDGKIVS
jgi:hypothetical protein